jgi:hypothetical protein
MRLTELYEGFILDPHRPPDRAKRNEVLGLVGELANILASPDTYRVSILRRFLNDNFLETLLSITIDSPEEQKCVDYMRDLLEILGDQLTGLPDGPIPDDLHSHLSLLRSSIAEFCEKYTIDRWSRHGH